MPLLDSFSRSFKYSKSDLFIIYIIEYKSSLNPSKGPYFNPTVTHSDIPSHIYSSLPTIIKTK